MKSFLAWIKNSVSLVFRGGFRFLFRNFFRLFWFLFRTTSLVIGAVVVTLVLVGIVAYSIAGDVFEHRAWQQGQLGFRFSSEEPREQGRRFDLNEKGYLSLNLARLSDQWTSPSPFLPFLDERGNLSRITLLETLRHAADDDNISALAVTADSFAIAQLGVAGVEDLRKAVERFRAKGKIAWFYTTDMGGLGAGSGLRSYYLASSFDSITLAPSGSLGFGGIRIEVPYFRNALDKLQITPEFEAREAYKSFPQQFLNSSVSDEVRENLQGMADGVARQWSREVERTRRLAPDIVARTLAQPYISASDAQLRGLVDRIAYPDKFWTALHDTLKNRTTQEDSADKKEPQDAARAASNAIPLLAYASYHRLGQFVEDDLAKRETRSEKEDEKKDMTETPSEAETVEDEGNENEEGSASGENADEDAKDEAEDDSMAMDKNEGEDESEMARVALLSWRGQIVRDLPQGGTDEQAISARHATRLLRSLTRDERFDAVILHIDSPGGDYIASDLIYHELKTLRKTKPVAVVMGDIAASGGYFIAMAGERVFAQPLTVTGSIGVFAGKIATRNFWQRWGVDWSVVQSGGESTMHSLLDSYGESDLTALSSALDDIYADFTSKVADARDLDSARIESLAGGRIWLGEQAVANELADAIGGFAEAKSWIVERLQRPEEQILFLPYPRESWSFRLRRLLRYAVTAHQNSFLLGDVSLLPLPLPLGLGAQEQAARHIAPLLSRRGALSAPYILLMP